ncbi:MAG: protein phosphatase 2C domain-containing protein, partial [Eubacteriales bacterium]
LENHAESLDVTIKQLPCTLLAVAVRGNDYLMFHLGDGVIAYRKEGKMLVASHPYNGEYANTTVFLTSPQAIRYAKVAKGTREKLEGFLLMSDGCERSLYSRKSCKLAPLTDKILQRAELYDKEMADRQVRCLLREIIIHTTMDDCSLAVMTRRQGDLGDWAHMTQRKRADILGIQTQNSNKRRRAIKKYATLFGVDTGNTGIAL